MYRELTLTDAAALALAGSIQTGTSIPIPAIRRGWAADANRRDRQLHQVATLSNQLRVAAVEDDATPGTQVNDRVIVAPGIYRIGSTILTLAAATVLTGFSGNFTYRVYADNNAGAARVAVTAGGGAWPATDHFKLAEVVKSGGVITTITDYRGADAMAKMVNATASVRGLVLQAVAVANIATPATATAEDCANKINALLASLRTAGVLAP